jgi:hypothetical protein
LFNNTNIKTAFRAKNTLRKQIQQNQESNEYNPVVHEIISTDRKKKLTQYNLVQIHIPHTRSIKQNIQNCREVLVYAQHILNNECTYDNNIHSVSSTGSLNKGICEMDCVRPVCQVLCSVMRDQFFVVPHTEQFSVFKYFSKNKVFICNTHAKSRK